MPLKLHQGGAPKGAAASTPAPKAIPEQARVRKLHDSVNPDSVIYVLRLHNGEVLELRARAVAADAWLEGELLALMERDAWRAPAPDTPSWRPSVTRGDPPRPA